MNSFRNCCPLAILCTSTTRLLVLHSFCAPPTLLNACKFLASPRPSLFVSCVVEKRDAAEQSDSSATAFAFVVLTVSGASQASAASRSWNRCTRLNIARNITVAPHLAAQGLCIWLPVGKWYQVDEDKNE